MSGKQVHRAGTWVLSIAMVAIGVALVAETISGSASASAVRLLLAAMFLAAGSGRIYLEIRRGRQT